jgi:tetratricopeptide (TPR) repeat protein
MPSASRTAWRRGSARSRWAGVVRPRNASRPPPTRKHLACLDSEIENLRAALEWAARRDDAGRLLELTVALREYWMRRDRYADAVSWGEQALRRPGADAHPRLRASALSKLPWPLWPLGRGAEAPALLSEGEAIARTLAEPAVLAEVLYNRAAILSIYGRRDIAAPLADEALSWARASGDPWWIAMAAWARAMAADSADELRERVDEAALLLEQAGNAYLHASVFQMAGYALLCRGFDREPIRYFQRSAPLVRRLDGDLDRAARLFGAAVAHRYGEPQDAVDARLHATFLDPARTRRGVDAWDAAVHDGEALSFNDAIAYALADGAGTLTGLAR